MFFVNISLYVLISFYLSLSRWSGSKRINSELMEVQTDWLLGYASVQLCNASILPLSFWFFGSNLTDVCFIFWLWSNAAQTIPRDVALKYGTVAHIDSHHMTGYCKAVYVPYCLHAYATFNVYFYSGSLCFPPICSACNMQIKDLERTLRNVRNKLSPYLLCRCEMMYLTSGKTWITNISKISGFF